jgi:hypothetical protein
MDNLFVAYLFPNNCGMLMVEKAQCIVRDAVINQLPIA